MSTFQGQVSAPVIQTSSQLELNTICCYTDTAVSRWTSRFGLSGDRLLARQALQLLMRLDRELREARADWNQDRFRRVMRARSKAVLRVRRRWSNLHSAPAFALGKLRRRYHANLAGYLNESENSRL